MIMVEMRQRIDRGETDREINETILVGWEGEMKPKKSATDSPIGNV